MPEVVATAPPPSTRGATTSTSAGTSPSANTGSSASVTATSSSRPASPALDARRYDLHERKDFTVREYRVIRERNRNFLVSPYYPRSGGMVVDWMQEEDGGETAVSMQTAKQSNQCAATVLFK